MTGWIRLRSHGQGGLRPARRLAAGLVSVTAAAACLASGAAAQATSATASLGGPASVPAGSVRLGAMAAGTVLRFDVALNPRDPAALSQFAASVSTPGSPLYRHYISPRQFAARFGATR